MSRRNRNKASSKNLPAKPPSSNNGAAQQLTARATHIERRSLSISKTYSGPVPPPELLAAYDEIVPGSAEKIINQFVAQGNHRMALEDTVIRGDQRRANWGLAAGFVLAMVTVVGSLYLAYLGKEFIGIGGLLISLGSLVGLFVAGTKSRRDERVEKEKLRSDK
jgi:uncharacterized membrane protein